MASRIHEILEGFRQRRLMVVGDIILDHYAFGSVTRISPEAPIQILDIEREEYRLGGAANVAHNLVALGAGVEIAGVVGEDVNSDILCELLRKKEIGEDGVVRDPTRPTTLKTRLISQGDHLLRTDREVRLPISEETQAKIARLVADKLTECDTLVLSDYAKGVLTDTMCRDLIALASRHNVKIFVGPKGKNWNHYERATLISANRVETETVSGLSIETVEDAGRAAQIFLKQLDLQAMVITLGARGMYINSRDQGGFHIPAEAREVFDVAGAGDTVLALLSLAGRSNHWKIAARLANMAAGIVVGKVGTSTVSLEELESEFSHGYTPHLEKIKTLPDLLKKLEGDRLLGRAVVFTNGCFDLLHPGHIRYLEYCKSRGDILVVGVNSDASVQAIKGENRPIVLARDRAEMLAALSCTDYVVIFDEPNPASLISQVRPDILIKGSDWRQKGIVGRELVESYGGKVEFYEVEEGYSSSKIIEKILHCYEKKERP